MHSYILFYNSLIDAFTIVEHEFVINAPLESEISGRLFANSVTVSVELHTGPITWLKRLMGHLIFETWHTYL